MNIKEIIRNKRLLLLFKGIVFPLIILTIFIILGLKYFSYLFFNSTNSNSNRTDISYIENENNDKDYLTIDKVDKPETKKVIVEKKEISKLTTTTKSDTNWWEYPKDIKQTTKSGNDLLVLVNKEYKLPSSYAPVDLVLAEKSGIRVKSKGAYYLRKILINDLKELNKAAKSDGIDLSIISAYRSYSTQASTYNYWVKYNKGCISCADKISARPGHSQHQLGTAVDFSSSEIGDRLGSEFDNTKASIWLTKNAYKYGFVISYPKGFEKITGYSYESWHYRYIGKDNAKMMRDGGLILEEFLLN